MGSLGTAFVVEPTDVPREEEYCQRRLAIRLSVRLLRGPRMKSHPNVAGFTAIGIGIGAAIGAATGAMAQCVAVGAALGAAVGLQVKKRSSLHGS